MHQIIELKNLEIWEYCMLDIKTGKKSFYKKPKIEGLFTGLYFKNDHTFFAIYPTESGPMMYYKEKEFSLKKDLHITLKKMGEWRKFYIREYGIRIKYRTSKYIGFDVWSTEIDVDLFYYIEQSYKTDAFYEKYAKYYEELKTKCD